MVVASLLGLAAALPAPAPQPPTRVNPVAQVAVLQVVVPSELHINRHAPNTLRLHAAGQTSSAVLHGLPHPSDPDAFGKINLVNLRWPLPHAPATLEGELFLCQAARGLCQLQRFKMSVPATQRGPLRLSATQITGELLR